VVALDISGSVSDEEIAHCLAEINAIKGQLSAKITLLACDAKLAEGGLGYMNLGKSLSRPVI